MNLEKFAKNGQIRPILRIGNPALIKPCLDVDIKSIDTMNIIQDMAATIQSMTGIAGLAANQIGFQKRIMFYQVVPSRADEYNPQGVDPMFLINPYYKPVGTEKITAWESCLSTPGLAAEVERYTIVHLTALEWKGQDFCAIDRLVKGYEARVIQHEIDHLDGIVYLSKRKNPQGISYVEEAKEFHIPK